MSTQPKDPTDPAPTMGPDALSYDCYGSVTTAEDELIVYDTEENDAWVQSLLYHDLEEMR